MALTVLSRDELRKAVVQESDDGAIITYYRISAGTHGSTWRFDRECLAKSPFHECLNIADRILNRPPLIFKGR